MNDSFRICFRWAGADAEDVEIAKATLARTLAKIKPWAETIEDKAPAH